MPDRSYGIIPLRIEKAQWQVFLIQQYAGHWGFPKGHAEGAERPFEAATRELFEETGLSIVRCLFEKSIQESYHFYFQNRRIYKIVEYFVSIVSGEPVLQAAEVKAGKWLALPQALEHLTFAEAKRLLSQVEQMLQTIAESEKEKTNG